MIYSWSKDINDSTARLYLRCRYITLKTLSSPKNCLMTRATREPCQNLVLEEHNLLNLNASLMDGYLESVIHGDCVTHKVIYTCTYPMLDCFQANPLLPMTFSRVISCFFTTRCFFFPSCRT